MVTATTRQPFTRKKQKDRKLLVRSMKRKKADQVLHVFFVNGTCRMENKENLAPCRKSSRPSVIRSSSQRFKKETGCGKSVGWLEQIKEIGESDKFDRKRHRWSIDERQ